MAGVVTMEPKEHLGLWWKRNVARLAVYLICASALTSFLGSLATGFNIGAFLYGSLLVTLIGGIGSLPGMILWLTGVGFLPPERSLTFRKAIAVSTGVVIGVPWQILFGSMGCWWAVAIYGVILPMGSGLIVSFRRRAQRPQV